MPLAPYTKPALTYAEQVALLKRRGLNIRNERKVRHLLENLSYYRLSGYWYPLLDNKASHIFKDEAQFQKAFALYCFDRELRSLVARELEKIEVSVRAVIVYHLSHDFNPFWYDDRCLFSNRRDHTTRRNAINREHSRSDADFITSFDARYHPSLPSWMALEICSFGTLSRLYQNLNPGLSKRKVANYYGVSDSVFESWLHTMVYIRNICAHHSRLWNKIVSIAPQVPRSIAKTTANGRITDPLWLKSSRVRNNKAYYSLSIIRFLLQTVNPKSKFTMKLHLLFKAYPNVDPKAMGFPQGWESEPMWKLSRKEKVMIEILHFAHRAVHIRL